MTNLFMFNAQARAQASLLSLRPLCTAGNRVPREPERVAPLEPPVSSASRAPGPLEGTGGGGGGWQGPADAFFHSVRRGQERSEVRTPPTGIFNGFFAVLLTQSDVLSLTFFSPYSRGPFRGPSAPIRPAPVGRGTQGRAGGGAGSSRSCAGSSWAAPHGSWQRSSLGRRRPGAAPLAHSSHSSARWHLRIPHAPPGTENRCSHRPKMQGH